VHAQTEDRSDNMRGNIYQELECVFDQLPKYHMKILLGNCNTKVGIENISKPTVVNGISHEINNDNAIRVVNFTTSKNVIVKSTAFPHRNIHKDT
jgi:hypothetical protein